MVPRKGQITARSVVKSREFKTAVDSLISYIWDDEKEDYLERFAADDEPSGSHVLRAATRACLVLHPAKAKGQITAMGDDLWEWGGPNGRSVNEVNSALKDLFGKLVKPWQPPKRKQARRSRSKKGGPSCES